MLRHHALLEKDDLFIVEEELFLSRLVIFNFGFFPVFSFTVLVVDAKGTREEKQQQTKEDDKVES